MYVRPEFTSILSENTLNTDCQVKFDFHSGNMLSDYGVLLIIENRIMSTHTCAPGRVSGAKLFSIHRQCHLNNSKKNSSQFGKRHIGFFNYGLSLDSILWLCFAFLKPMDIEMRYYFAEWRSERERKRERERESIFYDFIYLLSGFIKPAYLK